jgi:hypothetical protein
MFTNSIPVSGVNGSTSGDNTDATLETGEKTYGFGSNTVWWSWTAPVQGWYAVDTVGSAFDTVLGVWQGTHITNLTLVATNNNEFGSASLAAFVATTNKPYRLQVYGVDDASAGAIVLRWSPLVMVSQFAITSDWSSVWLERKGCALSQPASRITTQTTWMNAYGNVFVRTTVSTPSSSIASYENMYGKAVVTAQALQKAPGSAKITYFLPYLVLLRGTATPGIQFRVNGIAGSAFVAGMAFTIVSNYNATIPMERGVFATVTNTPAQNGLLYAQYRTMTPRWQIPAAPGAFMAFYENGLTIRTNAAGGSLAAEVFKKARTIGGVSIPLPASGTLNLRSSDRGEILYWTKALGTNGPMTLVNRRGVPRFSAFQPAGFATFSQCLFDASRLALVLGATGQTAQVALYAPRTAPQLNGTITVADFHSIGLDRACMYTVASITGVTTVCGYNNRLKQLWQHTARGALYGYYGGKTYALLSGTATNDLYSIYKAGALVSKHSYVRK